MYGGIPGIRSYAASSIGPIYHTQNQNKEIEFIRTIQQIVGMDPTFKRPQVTGGACLYAVHRFLNDGGNPAFIIPELRIGSSVVSNISCLDLVYRLSESNFEGLIVFWDNEGVYINVYFENVLRLGREKIAQELQTPLHIEQIIALLHSLLASDPYLSKETEIGNELLDVIERFYTVGGSPTHSMENIRVGHKMVARLTVFELLHLLWKLPYGYEFDVEQWEYEEEDWGSETEESSGEEKIGPDMKEPSINDRFVAIIDLYKTRINHMLLNNHLRDEDFLPVIRCLVEFSDDFRFDGSLSEDLGNQFITLMEHFVHFRVNPNLIFSQIEIGGSLYTNATCFHVVYLIWRHPKTFWNETLDQRFKNVFTDMLSDRRTDLTQRFSESSLVTHHFVNPDNIAYYSQSYTFGTKDEPVYFNGMLKPNSKYIETREGHSLERITIAHYAVIVNDYEMLTVFLEIEPRLLNLTCCLSKGKAILNREYGNDEYRILLPSGSTVSDTVLEKDDKLSGRLTVYKRDFRKFRPLETQIYRITNVSLLHLAARAGHETILACLTHQHPNPAAVDSDNKIPQHYLQLSVVEGIVQQSRQTQMMFYALNPVTKLQRHLALPQVEQMILREGYDLVYNTSRKVAFFVRQRLGKNSFGEATRTHHKWIDNLDIPELNRALDRDYIKSGYDRGHLVPAQDATCSETAMGDTFHPENAVPQNPNLNSGAWSRLESHVRQLALSNDLIEVFTGPLFLPEEQPGGRSIKHPVIGGGDIHVPTHLFKIIFMHNRDMTTEVYILPNHELPTGTKFTKYNYNNNPQRAVDFIQKHSGIIFNEWIQTRRKTTQPLRQLSLTPLLITSAGTSQPLRIPEVLRRRYEIQLPGIPGKNLWTTHETLPDGACALHALLGVEVNGKFVFQSNEPLDPSIAAREAFVGKVREKIAVPEIHSKFLYTLYSLLDEYHSKTSNGQAPSTESASVFQSEAGQRIYHQILAAYPNGFNNTTVEGILNHPDLREAYLLAVHVPGYYFADHEIDLAAHLFNKSVMMCEYNSGENRYVLRPTIFNPTATDFVLIAHRGNHYERCVPKMEI